MPVTRFARIGIAVALRATAPIMGLACGLAIASDSLPFRTGAARQYVEQHHTDRIILRLKNDADPLPFQALAAAPAMGADRVRSLSIAAIIELTPVRRTGSGGHVMRLPYAMAPADVAAIVDRLKADPSVAHVEIDQRRFPLLVPNDPVYIEQWNLRGAPGGINAETAWNRTRGSSRLSVSRSQLMRCCCQSSTAYRSSVVKNSMPPQTR